MFVWTSHLPKTQKLASKEPLLPMIAMTAGANVHRLHLETNVEEVVEIVKGIN